MIAYGVPSSPCPTCHQTMDLATEFTQAWAEQGPPTPGDSTICLYCATWLVFADDLTLRLATDEELAEIKTIPIAITVEKAVLELWKERSDEPA